MCARARVFVCVCACVRVGGLVVGEEGMAGYLGCFKHAEQEMCWTETEMQVHKSDPQFANLPYLPRVFSTRLSAQACAVYCITSKMKYTVILVCIARTHTHTTRTHAHTHTQSLKGSGENMYREKELGKVSK